MFIVVIGRLNDDAAAQPAARTADPAATVPPSGESADANPKVINPGLLVVGKPDAVAAAEAVDLSSLDLGAASSSSFGDKLNIYGFADFTFLRDDWSTGEFAPPDVRTFMVGNLNMYLARHLTPKARGLAEVRFTFLPNGSVNADGSVVDTTAQDLTNYGRPVQWGGIVIERAYIEYDLTDEITLRGGHWLTPYGIWNVDHGSPVILSIGKPYVIGEQFFPEHQTGLDLLGTHYFDDYSVSYHLTVSNGRGTTEAQTDQDSKFAFGGSLSIEVPWGLKLGGSLYRGRFTGVAATAGAIPETYIEASYGGDAQFDNGGFHFQSELVVRDRHYPNGMNTRDFGLYALVSYRFNYFWNITPFYVHEDNRPGDTTLFSSQKFNETCGLNLRPSPDLVFKLQGSYVKAADGSGLLAGVSLEEISGQASWMF